MQLTALPSAPTLHVKQRSLFESRWVQLDYSAQPWAIDIDFFDPSEISLSTII
jgi:hypothetical protein